MSLTFTVYHTCHLAGSLDNIFRNSPYECDTNDKQWLGVGYYFWTDSEYFAQKWGELDRKYPKGYVITEYQVEIPEESFLDLVGNVKDQLFFRKQILDYVERMGIELNSKEDARNIPISKVIDHLRTSSPQDTSTIKYDAIRAMDYSGAHTFSYTFTEGGWELIPIPTRQQLFLRDLSFLKIKKLFCAKQLLRRNGKQYKPLTIKNMENYVFKYEELKNEH